MHSTAKKRPRTGSRHEIVRQFYDLARVTDPSFISPYWAARPPTLGRRAHPDRRIRRLPLPRLPFPAPAAQRAEEGFPGKINIAFQFFPLEGKCNPSWKRTSIPAPATCPCSPPTTRPFFGPPRGDLASFQEAKKPGMAAGPGQEHGFEAALTDPDPRDLSSGSSPPGAEYEKTRTSTPTASAPPRP